MTIKTILTGDVNLMNVADPAVPFSLIENEFRASDIVLSVGLIRGEISAGQNFKGLGPEPKFFIHSLVVSARKERHANFEAD